MPETGATSHPTPLSFVQSDPFTEHLVALIGLAAGRVTAGLNLTYDGLTAHLSIGQAVVLSNGDINDPPGSYFIEFTAQVDKPLVANATNYLYLNTTADVIVNQTGIAPANSIPLYSIVTGPSAVTGTPTDLRSSLVSIGYRLKALGFDAGGNEFTNLGAPTASTSAARKQDVDAVSSAIGSIKNPVRIVTTANITLSGLQTLDGVALSSTDRVGVFGQTTTSQNGIYVAQSGAWTRATDFDSTVTIKGGVLIAVSEGTVNGNSVWSLDTDDPIVIGTTGLTFTRKDVQAHAALTTAHGAVSTAVASAMVVRDVNGRAKFVAGAASGDTLVYGQAFAAGDLTGSIESPTIGANVVGDTKLRQGGALSVIGRSANSAGNVADIAGTASQPQVLRVSGTSMGFGTIDHTYISDFDAQVRTSRLDQMAAPTADVSFNSHKITGLARPTASGDAVSLGNPEMLRVAVTGNVTMTLNALHDVANSVAATQTILTLPASPAVGDAVKIVADGNTGGFRVKENGSTNVIKFLASSSAASGSGYWQSVSVRSAIRLRCISITPNVWEVVWATGQFTNDAGVTQHMADSTQSFKANGFDASSARIQNVLDPTSAQDAATKAYADANRLSAANGKMATGTTSSTTAGTVIASLAAAAGKQLVALQFINFASAAFAIDVTLTFSDATTETITVNIPSGSTHGSRAGVHSTSTSTMAAFGTANAAKLVTQVDVKVSSGAGNKGCTIFAFEVTQ